MFRFFLANIHRVASFPFHFVPFLSISPRYPFPFYFATVLLFSSAFRFRYVLFLFFLFISFFFLTNTHRVASFSFHFIAALSFFPSFLLTRYFFSFLFNHRFASFLYFSPLLL